MRASFVLRTRNEFQIVTVTRILKVGIRILKLEVLEV
jgi:hypothetical protein